MLNNSDIKLLEELVGKVVEKKLIFLEESVTTLDLKIEVVNKKLDSKVNKVDVVETLERILNTVDILNSKLDQRITRLEKHTGLS